MEDSLKLKEDQMNKRESDLNTRERLLNEKEKELKELEILLKNQKMERKILESSYKPPHSRKASENLSNTSGNDNNFNATNDDNLETEFHEKQLLKSKKSNEFTDNYYLHDKNSTLSNQKSIINTIKTISNSNTNHTDSSNKMSGDSTNAKSKSSAYSFNIYRDREQSPGSYDYLRSPEPESNKSSSTSIHINRHFQQHHYNSDENGNILNKIMPITKSDDQTNRSKKINMNITTGTTGSNKSFNDFTQYLTVKDDKQELLVNNALINNIKTLSITPNGNKTFTFDPSIYTGTNNNVNVTNLSKYSNNSRNNSLERDAKNVKTKSIQQILSSKSAKRVNSSIPHQANTQKNVNNSNKNIYYNTNTMKGNYANFDSERAGNYNTQQSPNMVVNKTATKYNTILASTKERSTTPVSYTYNNKKSTKY